MFNKKLKEKRGGSTVLEIVISIGLITFILFFPIGTFTMMHKQNLLNDVLTTGLQIVAVEGGLTDRAEDLIYKNLEAKGLLPENSEETDREKIDIISNADARQGKTENLVLRYDSNPKLNLEIRYPATGEIRMINTLGKLIGISEDNRPFKVDGVSDDTAEWQYIFKGYVLSEKIDY